MRLRKNVQMALQWQKNSPTPRVWGKFFVTRFSPSGIKRFYCGHFFLQCVFLKIF